MHVTDMRSDKMRTALAGLELVPPARAESAPNAKYNSLSKGALGKADGKRKAEDLKPQVCIICELRNYNLALILVRVSIDRVAVPASSRRKRLAAAALARSSRLRSARRRSRTALATESAFCCVPSLSRPTLNPVVCDLAAPFVWLFVVFRVVVFI